MRRAPQTGGGSRWLAARAMYGRTRDRRRYRWSLKAAAEILNLHWGGDEPKHVLLAKLTFVILAALHEAEAELQSLSSHVWFLQLEKTRSQSLL